MTLSQVKIPTIYFHSIQDNKDPNWTKNFLTLDIGVFELFLRYLRDHRWQTLFLDEMHELKRKDRKPRGKYCCLTFDDGYLDNYIFAYPMLQKYGFKATIFVSPECVDLSRSKSPTLFDVWNGEQDIGSLLKSAYLSWEEIHEMQASGVIDIQSHTMSHTKYFASDKIVSFHYPGDDCFYPIVNSFPEYKTSYFGDPGFEKLIPYGSPLLEERSAVITRKYDIDSDFQDAVVSLLAPQIHDGQRDVTALMEAVRPVYQGFKARHKILHCQETDDQYRERLIYEIVHSKSTLERELAKEVNFLCWPHGDNTAENHQMALQAGYKATTVGKSGADPSSMDRFDRTGIHVYKSPILTRLGIRYKLRSYSDRFPENLIRHWHTALAQ